LHPLAPAAEPPIPPAGHHRRRAVPPDVRQVSLPVAGPGDLLDDLFAGPGKGCPQ
jgi:hypothetical protein